MGVVGGGATGSGVKVLVTLGRVVGEGTVVEVAGIGVLMMVGVSPESLGTSLRGEQAKVPRIRNRHNRNSRRFLFTIFIIIGSVYQKRVAASILQYLGK